MMPGHMGPRRFPSSSFGCLFVLAVGMLGGGCDRLGLGGESEEAASPSASEASAKSETPGRAGAGGKAEDEAKENQVAQAEGGEGGAAEDAEGAEHKIDVPGDTGLEAPAGAVELWPLLAELPEDDDKVGIVFAEAPGQTVPLTIGCKAGGEGLALADGTKVRVKDRITGVGIENAEAEIEVDGKTGCVPNHRVLTGGTLLRSEHAAVFHEIRSCGDVCHGETWLFTEAERRPIELDTGPEVNAVFMKDGTVLIGNGDALLAIDLKSGKTTTHLGVTAPAIGPNGEIWVRGTDGVETAERFTLAGKRTPVFEFDVDDEVPKLYGTKPGDEEETDGGDDEIEPSGPSPVRFEDDGKVVVVVIDLGESLLEVRMTPEGKRLSIVDPWSKETLWPKKVKRPRPAPVTPGRGARTRPTRTKRGG